MYFGRIPPKTISFVFGLMFPAFGQMSKHSKSNRLNTDQSGNLLEYLGEFLSPKNE